MKEPVENQLDNNPSDEEVRERPGHKQRLAPPEPPDDLRPEWLHENVEMEGRDPRLDEMDEDTSTL